MQIKLIIGLGNPGKEYQNTRHNIGFIFVDALAKSFDATDFRFNKKLNSQISEVLRSPTSKFPRSRTSIEVGLRLAKPQTFMNKSGQAVAALVRFYKIKPENILVIHDDIDISWGNFKLSFGRSSAGHKGVESIIKALKTKNFWRLRIGIQPAFAKATAGKPTKKIKADKIILKKFTETEKKQLLKLIRDVIKKLEI